MKIREALHNPGISYTIRFLGCYALLYLLFPFLRGIAAPGGFLSSDFIANHCNPIKGFTAFLTSSAKWLLHLFGYDARQNGYHILRIEYSRGVIVNPSCLGWAVMSFWVAFVYANRGSFSRKLKWALAGIFAICLLNIARIALIAAANHENWTPITSLDHHQTFNIASYGCIFLLVLWFMKVQKKYEQFVGDKERRNQLVNI